MVERNAMTVRAREIGRECCEFWVGCLGQPDVPTDPQGWELSDFDRRMAFDELGIDAASPVAAAVLEALEAGFMEERRHVVQHVEHTARSMVDNDIASWRSEGLFAGMVERARRGDDLDCEWDARGIRDLGCECVEAVMSSYGWRLRRALLEAL